VVSGYGTVTRWHRAQNGLVPAGTSLPCTMQGCATGFRGFDFMRDHFDREAF